VRTILGNNTFRRRVLTAIGAGALLALTPHCADDEEDITCASQVPHQSCVPLGQAMCTDGGFFGEVGAAGSGEPATCPTALEAQECFGFYAHITDQPPMQNGQQCCYIAAGGGCLGGRPFTVEGVARTASPVARSDWSQSLELEHPTPIDTTDAAVIARGWLEDALAEHASVASFARFTLELLALGAPSDLVLAAQQAGLDEVRHAQVCFALASRYADSPMGPGALETHGSLATPDLASFAARTVREGCSGETIAALVVAEQARCAADPALRRALESLARDEASHAELAWKAVRWALDQGGAPVRAAVAQAFEDASRPIAAAHASDEADLRRHGRLRAVDSAAIAARATAEVIDPCAQALLDVCIPGASTMKILHPV
jgi:hypothetical protein